MPEHGALPDVTDPQFAPFWDATRQERIAIPRCDACTRFVWPPRPICPNCYADRFTWTDVATEGHLFSWTVVQHATVDTMSPGYVAAIVELEGGDGLRLLGNLWDYPPEDLRVGMRVHARFDRVTSKCTLVNWVVAEK